MLDQIRKLPAKDPIELVDEIVQGLPADAESESESSANLTPEQIAELERRMAEHEADPDSAIPWSEVQRDIEARFGWKL